MFRGLSLLLVVVGLDAASSLAQERDDVRFRAGSLKVRRHTSPVGDRKEAAYHTILRDQINFGECFEDKELRRLPGTYYHPLGPVGMALQRFNWFPGAPNTYSADVRLPASLAAMSVLDRLGPMIALWSEPPVAVIGLEAGTPASYARPTQQFHFYEMSKDVIDLNERAAKERFFHFVADARTRGAFVSLLHGPPRAKLAKEGPRGFYRLMILEACSGEDGEKIFLDLFTKEGIAQCFENLAEDGVLCVHTSHRYLDLPPVLAAIARDLKIQVRRGHDMAPGADRGRGEDLAELRHFTTEWVMLARRRETLDWFCQTPKDYDELVKKNMPFRVERYWDAPAPRTDAWTDKGPNLLHGVLHGHPFAQRYSAVMGPVTETVSDWLPIRHANKRFILDLGSLNRGIEGWMVRAQLMNNPQVEKLWP